MQASASLPRSRAHNRKIWLFVYKQIPLRAIVLSFIENTIFFLNIFY